MVKPTHFVIFGDFYEARTAGWKDVVVDGIPKMRFKLFPTKPLMKAYNIKYEEINKNPEGFIEKDFDSLYLAYDNSDPENRRIFLLCNYNNEETALLRKIEKNWMIIAKNIISENNTLRKALKRDQHLLKTALSQPEELEKIMQRRVKNYKEIVGTEIIQSDMGGDLENV